MEYLEYRFTLDMHKSVSQISLPVRQYETNRRLLISFSNKGSPYTITDGCTAVLGATKADSNTLLDNCIIENNTTIVYEFNEQTASALGIVECSIILYGPEGEVITSPHFIIVVSKNAVEYSEVKSTSESTTIAKMLANETARQSAEETRQSAEETRQNAETIRQSNETARQSNETARQSAETIRQSNETARQSAEETRQNAETIRQSNETARQSNETARQSAETIRQSNETARQSAEETRQKAYAEIKGTAIGKPEWNSENGKLTFKYLDGNTAGETIDLPIESIVKSGKFDSENETLVLTLRNGEELSISASNLLNPTWTTDIASASEGQLLTPPTTEAVNNALSEKLDETDIADWAKQPEKPTYTADEVGAATEKYVDDRIPKFTASDSGKFITVSDDGSLVATEITVGGAY